MYGRKACLFIFLILFLSVSPLSEFANAQDQNANTTITLPRSLDHAKEFIAFLKEANLRVERVGQSHFTGFLGSQKMAAFIATEKGNVEVVFLDGDARQVTVTYKKGLASKEQHIYTVNGEGVTGKTETINAAYPIYFTIHNNWLIITHDCEMEALIKRSLGQNNRVK